MKKESENTLSYYSSNQILVLKGKQMKVTMKTIDKYLNGMAYNASKTLFAITKQPPDFDDLKQEAQLMKLHAWKTYDITKNVPLASWIIIVVKRHFIYLARHLRVVERHKEKEAKPESFLPVCDSEEKEYCKYLLSLIKIDMDKEMLLEYIKIQNMKIVGKQYGVSKERVSQRIIRAIRNIKEGLKNV